MRLADRISAWVATWWPSRRETDLNFALDDLNAVFLLAFRLEKLGFEVDAQALRRAAMFASKRVATALSVYDRDPRKDDA